MRRLKRIQLLRSNDARRFVTFTGNGVTLNNASDYRANGLLTLTLTLTLFLYSPLARSGDAEIARHENAGLENAAQSCRGWKMQEWKKREKKSMTQDTDVKVERVNRGMSIRRLKKKNSLLNHARIKACISRYVNSTYTRIQFLRAVGHCIGSHAVCPEDGSAESDVDDDDNQEEVSVDSGDDGRPAVSRCCISGSLRSLHDSTARHTTSVCALRTPALFQVLWFLQCITKIEEEGRGYPMCRAPITKILRLF